MTWSINHSYSEVCYVESIVSRQLPGQLSHSSKMNEYRWNR